MNRRRRVKIVAVSAVLIAAAVIWMRTGIRPIYGFESTPLQRIESDDTAFLAYTPDGSILTDFSWRRVTIRNPITGEAIRSFGAAGEGYTTTEVSPDGSRLAIGGVEKTLTVYDLATGETVLSCTHTGMARSLAFSPDGTRLAAAIMEPQTAPGRVQVWDARTGAGLLKIDNKTSMMATGYSPDGAMILSGEWDMNRNSTNPGSGVTFWDAQSGKEISRIPLPGNLISETVLSPDGKCVLVLANDRDVWLCHIASGKNIASYSAHQNSVCGIGFSPDGRRVVVGDSGFEAMPPSIASGISSKIIKNLGLESYIEDLYAIFGMRYRKEDRGSVYIYDTETAKLLKVLLITEDPLRWMDISPDGKHIATSTGRAVAIRDVGDAFGGDE